MKYKVVVTWGSRETWGNLVGGKVVDFEQPYKSCALYINKLVQQLLGGIVVLLIEIWKSPTQWLRNTTARISPHIHSIINTHFWGYPYILEDSVTTWEGLTCNMGK